MNKIVASWSKGMRGNQLRFRHKRRLFTCTWTQGKPHRMQIMVDGGEAEIMRRRRKR